MRRVAVDRAHELADRGALITPHIVFPIEETAAPCARTEPYAGATGRPRGFRNSSNPSVALATRGRLLSARCREGGVAPAMLVAIHSPCSAIAPPGGPRMARRSGFAARTSAARSVLHRLAEPEQDGRRSWIRRKRVGRLPLTGGFGATWKRRRRERPRGRRSLRGRAPIASRIAPQGVGRTERCYEHELSRGRLEVEFLPATPAFAVWRRHLTRRWPKMGGSEA